MHICKQSARSGRLATLALAGALTFSLAGCGGNPADDAPALKTDAVYDKGTGLLKELHADLDGDGRNDATAFMEGTRLQRIEVDRDNDGQVDRWEYYDPGTSTVPTGRGNQFDRWAVLARAEESDLKGGPIVRREFYGSGVVQRVEEDTTRDGKADKWEFYIDGVLEHVDLDLLGKGYANRRLVYAPSGDVVRIESDESGTGAFAPVAQAH
jgi:hypothetical protein